MTINLMRPYVHTFILSCLLVGALSPAAAQDLTPYDLRAEFQRAPLGLDEPVPRLSWALRANERGQHQTAYRLLVASTPEALRQERGDVWDSGRVASEETHLIPYAGPPLEAGQTYHWAVRVWDRRGAVSAWSAPSTWTMGRMGDWGVAQWVGLDSVSHAALGLEPDQLPRFRRAFRLEKPVQRALVHVAGLGSFELYANGEKVSRDVLAPAWTDYRETVLYATYDVTGRLREGANALGVALGHGMYHIPGTPENGRFAKFFGSFGPPKLILYLTVEHPDGSATRLVSDGAWRVGGSPVLFSSIWGGEDYDARLEESGWAAPGFDDSAWVPAAMLPGPGGTLVAQATPPLRVQEVHRPVDVAEPEPGVYVYDLGQNLSGWPQLTVRGPAGATVKLTPSEVLGPDGRINPTSMKHWGEIAFHYTLRGEGAETWQPRFTYTGFRYVQVEGATPDPAEAAAKGIPLLLGLESHFVHADAERTGQVATSSPLLDGIHEIIVDAIRSNLMSVMTDCPHREKLGWLEQAYLHASGIHFNVDAALLYAKWTRDMAEAQLEDGLVPDIAPEFTVFEGGFRDSPEWGSALILAPWAAYLHYGDARPLRAHYDAMKAYVAYLEARRDERGVLDYGLGDWYDIGPGPPGPSKLTSLGVTATAIYITDLRVLAQIARLLEKPDEAAAFAERAEAAADAFNAAFFDEEKGVYDRESQTAQALPLVLGLVPPGREGDVLGHLVRDIESRGMHTTAGDIGHRYVLTALREAGRSDLVYAMAVNPEPPSYAAQYLSGATTLTEAWDANPNSSQNHFMLGHLEEWLYQGLGGLRPDPEAPGFQRVTVHPEVIDALGEVDVTYHSVRGPFRSAWRRDGEALHLDVEVPPGATAQVHVPASDPTTVREGEHPAAEAEGVTFLRAESGRAVYQVGSGRYRFRVQ